MDATTPSEQERTEVELVLQSGVFDKAPRLGRFFRYIIDRHFDGQADQIKEYSIAVEALGRGADFDPKKDSIVRVEAHRLRKRLEEFYRGPGADHALRIAIPNGQYRPQFLSKSHANGLAPLIPEHPPSVESPVLELLDLPELRLPADSGKPDRRLGWWSFLVSSLLIICGVVVIVVRLHRTPAKASVQTDQATADTWDANAWNQRAGRAAGAELRILAGYHGPLYVDRQGHTWNSDAFFHGGSFAPLPRDEYVEGQPDPHLLRSMRFGRFRYDIPLPQGTYEVHLFFAETVYGRANPQGGGEGARTFHIAVNGQIKFSLFDPLAQAGAPDRLHEVVMKDITPASDGVLHLRFEPAGTAPAILNALEILPSQRGRVHPVRMVMQPNPVTDSDGRLWAADEYFVGGTEVLRENVLLNPKERALYQGERYGNFAYRIPLAPGKYRLTLHFAEQWFGTENTQNGPLDSRMFDVYANRVALLKDLRVGKEAHGANRSLEKRFDDLQPNAQGILLLEFVPLRNYAELNALEVIQMP